MKEGKLRDFFLDIFFPKFCFVCQKEGQFICQDCFSLLEINTYHQQFKGKYLDDLYFAIDYQNRFFQKIFLHFKYPPLIRELKNDLANIILSHFLLLEEKVDFTGFVVVAVPLSFKKLRWRGFNQAEEIAEKIADFFQLPLITSCLIKIRETKDQVNLSEKERRINVKEAFKIKEKEIIKEKNVLLVDDVFTTGSTMEECARVLKENGAKKVIGIVLARAKAGNDKIN